MRITLHALQMRPQITGTDRVAHNVLRELQELDRTNEYTVLCFPEDTYVPAVLAAPNFRVVRIRRRKLAAHAVATRVPAAPPDAELSFHNLVVPLPKRAPTVVTALDLVPLVTDHYHPSRVWRSLHRRLIARAIRRADRFAAISHFTKRELVDRCGVSPERVAVVPLAPDPAFREETDERTLSAVRARYGLPGRFLLVAGGSDPRKNARTVLRAYSRLPAEVKRAVPAVLIGATWHDQALPDDGTVRALGHVSDDDLRALLSLADAFAFLSLYEGFGLPPLEAMACGAPVLCSNTTSLPEVVGDAAVLVDPTDVDEVAAALTGLLENDARRTELAVRGLTRATQFTWRHTAAGVLEALQS